MYLAHLHSVADPSREEEEGVGVGVGGVGGWTPFTSSRVSETLCWYTEFSSTWTGLPGLSAGKIGRQFENYLIRAFRICTSLYFIVVDFFSMLKEGWNTLDHGSHFIPRKEGYIILFRCVSIANQSHFSTYMICWEDIIYNWRGW